MNKRTKDLTRGKILSSMLLFAVPMIAGNILQQLYNLADTLIVGRGIGADALAAVGSAFTLMVFLNSVIIGLCMGSGALFSGDFGSGNMELLVKDIRHSFAFIGGVTVVIYVLVYAGCDTILRFQNVPEEIFGMMKSYCLVIFAGIGFIFLYNFFAYVLRAMGDSLTPLVFLGISSILNVGLDLLFVLGLKKGVAGAALATVISQGVSGIGITAFVLFKSGELLPQKGSFVFDPGRLRFIVKNDFFTCMQQSVMNFGILMIQGLVNSFGTMIMAAFAAGVKVDTISYLPSQEFANAYSLFVSQNYGAGQKERIRKGTKYALVTSAIFCITVSALVFLFAEPIMGIFVKSTETDIILAGVKYLRIEGVFYLGIGWLFIFYGYYRGIGMPEFSLVLTITSLGTRVVLAYAFAPRTPLMELAIWISIPIGWILADIAGFLKMRIVEGE